jgi:hypothetical protein
LISKWIQDVKPTEEKEMNESSLNANDPHGDYKAKSKALQDLSMTKDVDQSAVQQRKLDLDKEYAKHNAVKEAVIQPNGTDKIDTKTSEPTSDVGKFPQKTVKKGMITFYNYTKAQKIKEQHSMSDKKKDNESDHDYENQIKVTDIDKSEVGHSLVAAGGQDNLRRRKVKYHLGEEVTENPAAKELVKANLAAKHAKEKESLASKHEREKESMKESALERFRAAAAEREKKHDEIERKRKEDAAQGKENMSGAIDRLEKHLNKEQVSTKKKPLAGAVATAKSFDPFFEEEELEERAKFRRKFINGQWVVDLKNTVDENYDQTIEVATPDTTLETSEENDVDDKEIEAMIGQLSDDDIMGEYDEDELALVDEETGEEIPKSEEENVLDEQALMEVLSRMERMKAKFRIRRTAAKRERATKIALKRYSNTATINKRSRRLAIKLMKQRLLRGRDPSKISVGEKERIERTIEKRKAVIGRIATRLVSRVRKVEKSRMSHTKFTQGSQPSVF